MTNLKAAACYLYEHVRIAELAFPMMHGSMRRVNCLFGKRAEACEMIRHVVNTLIKNVVCVPPDIISGSV